MPGLQAVDAALDRTAARLSPVVRNHAREAGWPADIAARLSMTRTPQGTLSVDYSGDVAEAQDMEYGTPEQAPRSVLTFFDSVKGKQVIKKATLDSMDELHDRIQGLFS